MALIYGNGLQTNGSTQTARSAAGAGSSVTDNFSMSAWVKVNSFPGSGRAIFFDNGADDARGWALYVDTAGVFRTDVAFVVDVSSGFTANTGVWYHVGVIRNAGTWQMYVNGSASGGTQTNNPNSGADYVSVGSGTDSGGNANNFFDGVVDDARLYERAISSSEMAQLYANGNVWPYTDISSTSLKLWYKLDETSGTSAADSSGGGATLTTANSPSWVTGIVAIGSTAVTSSPTLLLMGVG